MRAPSSAISACPVDGELSASASGQVLSAAQPSGVYRQVQKATGTPPVNVSLGLYLKAVPDYVEYGLRAVAWSVVRCSSRSAPGFQFFSPQFQKTKSQQRYSRCR